MKRAITYEITEKHHNKTIQQFLKDTGYSHAVIVQLKKTEEGILKNGIWSYVNDKLSAGDTLHVHWKEESLSDNIVPVDLPFHVVYEDEDILVVNKPANMPIHPSMNNYDNTLANAAMYYFQQKGESFTYRCINRLDRDTSGLTILAKNMLSGGILAKHSGLREIKREYVAIVSGNTPAAGTIDVPIARLDGSTIERCVDFEKGEHAVTHYWKLAYDAEKNLSLIRLKLETGRTHQIRVHMKYAGFPLIGDFLYNPDYRYIQRQALHSVALTFVHPITGEEMHFEAPLPADMASSFTCD
ncbi:MAG: RluA family pseudouridine synthase [Eubacterium sp.]|nr:RluA family pseudouridine synthase [Eubacterium sp.]